MNKNNLDELIIKYKNELNKSIDNVNPELEIRFKNTNFNIFKSIYEYMINNVESSKIELTQILSCLMKQKTENQLQITNIKNIYYNKGIQFKKEYLSKIPLHNLYYNFNNIGLTYNIVLSIEKNNIKEFIIDESSIIRIKNRITFILIENNIQWKLDMTIVRQLFGNNIRLNLENDIYRMFKQYETNIDNILTIFNDSTYNKYEIEIELINNLQVRSNDVLNIGNNLLTIINPNYLIELNLQNKIHVISKFLKVDNYLKQNKLTLKQLLPKVKTLTHFEYKNIYPPIGFYITDKADGIRSIGMYEDNKGFIISNKLISYENVKINNYKLTIVDGELIDDKLYIFDIIAYDGENISNMVFDERIKKLKDAITILSSSGMKCEVKKYIQLTKENIKNSIEEIYYQKNRPYNIDGLIFVKPNNSYLKTETFKWKKIEDNTIDFLVKKVPESLLDTDLYIYKKNYTLYLLFVGINYNLFQSFRLQFCNHYNEIFNDQKIKNNSYFPIQFSVSNAPKAYIYYHPDDSLLQIENNIVEFKCTGNCFMEDGYLVNWVPIKIREDRKDDLKSNKYFGNDYKIAETIWINYMNPFYLEQLWENISDEYFITNKSGIYNAQTAVVSYFKNTQISLLKGYKWIIDIGSGKGQDLKRYFNAKIENFIAIDNDKASLAELIRRKYIFAKEFNILTNVYVVLADMTIDYNINIQKIYNLVQDLPENKNIINAIVCNLSIHYYIYTEELLKNFINFTLKLLKNNGKLIITCLFGENVFNLLKNINEGNSWNIYDNNILKYSIKKMYSSKSLENIGQKIGILLPFSNGNYYEECLVNTDYLIKTFKLYGLELIEKTNISINIINDFKKSNNNIGSKLNNDDITYLSLYGKLVFNLP